jgi:spore photoproduct lyase
MSRIQVHFQTYQNLDGSKTHLVQRVGSGSIIKRFDRTPTPKAPTDVVCPHFLELKWAYGCPYKCAWCYLQGTLRLLSTKTKPVIKDYPKIKKHLLTFFKATNNGTGYPKELLNTGELADSLMWENNGNPFSEFIVNLFETQTKHKILFLSKSTSVKNILRLDSDRIIPSFTLNSPMVSRRWEIGAPRPKDRIQAAKSLEEVGYQVRVRIDPIVPIPQWQDEYRKLIDSLFSSFQPERITLGSLRGLQSTINNSRDKTWVSFLNEGSNWGRKVSFALRKQMYLELSRYISEVYGYTRFALCKETKTMWNQLDLNYKNIICNCIS